MCCCAGTTAFPTLRWLGGNDPEKNSFFGPRNLVELALQSEPGLRRFVFVSSAGVKRYDQGPPYSILNAFGVLQAKEKAEDFLTCSGLPYTIVRPGRLTDAPYVALPPSSQPAPSLPPSENRIAAADADLKRASLRTHALCWLLCSSYTSYDLNTLLKGESGTRKEVAMALGERLDGEASRAAVAEACLQSLRHPFMVNTAFSIESVVGEGPGTDDQEWIMRFKAMEA